MGDLIAGGFSSISDVQLLFYCRGKKKVKNSPLDLGNMNAAII